MKSRTPSRLLRAWLGHALISALVAIAAVSHAQTAQQDRGYDASSAMSSTQTNEKLENLPNAISVLHVNVARARVSVLLERIRIPNPEIGVGGGRLPGSRVD
jgi:hypothetical protein